ncbi:FecR family protein [Pseudozobellia thermophila]|uniref:FecR family protein n=1 Tax=Pseudozobellia thermophila TaxID=192903 RepID=A0A1M6KUW9_9FLAO|nr:FecR domain-containing protein [Pseudozobellia thermophila]SHJ62777.1 FecR family protein [Pseudozobellia thermophila]
MEFKLIIKKIENALSESEAEIFDRWYAESPEHRDYFHRVQQAYRDGPKKIENDKAWAKVFSKIKDRRRKKSYLKYAAGITLLLALASFWATRKSTQKTMAPVPSVVSVPEGDRIEAGSDRAVLTLEDGTQVVLDKGRRFKKGNVSSNGEELVYANDGAQGGKTVAQNILDIPRGGQFHMVLSDGTKVWVNAKTKLKYPVAFAPGETRKVELVYGEAYFEVSPSTAHGGSRFIVMTGEHEVEVLGTQFNIKAYGEEPQISTTLVEGKVKVGNGTTKRDLSPGYQSRFERDTEELAVVEVDVYDEISWKNGFFSFKDKPLEDIMEVLSRWYDFDVRFEEEGLRKLTFNGVFRRAEDIEDILNIIRQTNEVDYEIDQKTITIK